MVSSPSPMPRGGSWVWKPVEWCYSRGERSAAASGRRLGSLMRPEPGCFPGNWRKPKSSADTNCVWPALVLFCLETARKRRTGCVMLFRVRQMLSCGVRWQASSDGNAPQDPSWSGYRGVHFVGAKWSLPEVFSFGGSLPIANQHLGECWWKIGTEEGCFRGIFIVLFMLSELAQYFPLVFDTEATQGFWHWILET